MLWKGFQRPKRLEFERETLTDRFGRFYAQPFERGFGTTIGNALRACCCRRLRARRSPP
jgi:DNA-directed RNA polymerase subunit alpha